MLGFSSAISNLPQIAKRLFPAKWKNTSDFLQTHVPNPAGASNCGAFRAKGSKPLCSGKATEISGPFFNWLNRQMDLEPQTRPTLLGSIDGKNPLL